MNDPEASGREGGSNSLWRVIEDFESGALSPEAERELFQILEESPQARSLYLAHFELSALLQMKAETKKEPAKKAAPKKEATAEDKPVAKKAAPKKAAATKKSADKPADKK